MASQEKVEVAIHHSSAPVQALTAALAAPFVDGALRFKPGKVSGSQALALPYVDARAIQDRLDDVLGVLGWQDEYECLPDGAVVCRLRLRLGEEWITKMDVGAPSAQPDEGDRRKAAFSDALKRAAVKFGIGRYLYRVGPIWADFDPQKKRFVRPPTLPAEALTKRKPATGKVRAQAEIQEPRVAAAPSAAKPVLPANGLELQQRLNAYDSRLAIQGLCQPGELVKYVVGAGVKAGHEPDLARWHGAAIGLAVAETRAFEGMVRRQSVKHKEVA